MKKIYFLSLLAIISIAHTNAQNALHFDGIDDFVSIPDQNSLDLLAKDDMTIEFWFKITSTADFLPIIAKTNVENKEEGYAVSMYNGYIGVAKIGIGSSMTNAAQINTTTTFNDGKWHHFAAVLPGTDAADYQIYIDEQVTYTAVAINNFSGEMTNSIDLKIGKASEDWDLFEGTLDELRIWDRALTLSEIDSFSNAALTGNENGLIVYYDFNQGIANGNNEMDTTLTDMSSHKANGKLNNFALNGTTSNWVDGVKTNALSTSTLFNYGKQVGLFPNPCNNYVQLNGLNKSFDYVIYDVLGSEVMRGNTNSNRRIELFELSEGLYYLNLDQQIIRFMKK